MSMPFPVGFWTSPTGPTLITVSWSDTITVAEVLSYVKVINKTWSDTVSVVSESVSVVKTSIKAFSVIESVTVGDAWVRTITSLTPAAPSGFTATRQANQGGVNLAWTDNSTNETAFVIEISLNGSSWSELKTVGANITSSTDWATFPTSAPTITSIDSVNDDTISLTWSASAQATSYKVYRSTVSQFVPGDSNSTLAASPTGTTTSISGLTQNTPYYIIVRAINSYGDGAFSAISTKTTGPTVPQSFTYPYATDRYNLSWSNGTRDDTLIRIERSLNSGGSWGEINTVSAGGTTYSDIRSYSASTLYRIRYDGEVTYAT